MCVKPSSGGRNNAASSASTVFFLDQGLGWTVEIIQSDLA